MSTDNQEYALSLQHFQGLVQWLVVEISIYQKYCDTGLNKKYHQGAIMATSRAKDKLLQLSTSLTRYPMKKKAPEERSDPPAVIEELQAWTSVAHGRIAELEGELSRAHLRIAMLENPNTQI